MYKKVIFLLPAIALVGCGKEEVKSVKWYKQNETARTEMLSKCKENSGELKLSANCVNAQDAESALSTEDIFGKGIAIQ